MNSGTLTSLCSKVLAAIKQTTAPLRCHLLLCSLQLCRAVDHARFGTLLPAPFLTWVLTQAAATSCPRSRCNMSSSLHALPTRPRLGGTLSGQAHAVMKSRIAGAQELPCCSAGQHAFIAERSRLLPPASLPPPRDGGSAKVQCSAHSHSACALAPAIALPRCNASEVRRLLPRCCPASQPQRPSPPCQVAQALQPFFHRMAAEFPLKTEADDAVAPLRLRDRDDDRAEGGGRKREGGGMLQE